jgi:riboflavin kinase/FMN adenylyltransferase
LLVLYSFLTFAQQMKVHTNLESLPHFKNAVLTIGSFDGVHKGHQKIIEQLRHMAEASGGESVLLTFHPHPRSVVDEKEGGPKLLTTLEEKIALLESYGIDHLVVVPFTRAFSDLSPEAYIGDFLVGKFRPKHIVIGYDHRFGKNRAGNLDLLVRLAPLHGFSVTEIPKQTLEDIAVSSTKIRKAVELGDVKTAANLLNHPFVLSGMVVAGQQIGRQLGYPTANVQVDDTNKLIPPDGIYAARVLVEGQRLSGMLYIGNRPSLEDGKGQSVEIHIFDFKNNIYNKKVVIELVEKTRDDQRFDSMEQLRQRLAQDEAEVKAVLGAGREERPKVAVVLLNYNTRDLLERFLPFVCQTQYGNLEIWVADNASTDGSLEMLHQRFPMVKTLSLAENFGFAKGYNEALRQVDAPYYALLNTDVEVATNWIKPFVDLLEHDKNVAVCQAKIKCYTDKSLFEYAGGAGGWLDKWGYPFCRGRIFDTLEKDEGQYDAVAEIFWASGAAMFVRSEVFHGLGGFDGDYFAHMEEIDFCWRAKRAGYKVMACPASVAYHIGGGTLAMDNPRKTYLNFRNNLATLLKNEHAGKLLWLLPLRLLLDGASAIRFLIKGEFGHIFAIVRAHWHFFWQVSHILRKRKHYNKGVAALAIAPTCNRKGVYSKSIVWEYFIMHKRKFSEL